MKLTTKFLILFTSLLLIINGCDKPAITELTQDEEQIEVEVLSKDTSDIFYSADSSGVVDDLIGYTNVVTVSGIKITQGSTTISTAFAQAIFFDKSKPVRRGNGRIIGYETRILGDVQFNNVHAIKTPYKIRFKEGNTPREVNLGFRHVLNSLLPGHDFNFEYSSFVSFNLDFLPILNLDPFGFNIETPSEIRGNVRFEGKRGNKTLKAILKWNGENHPKFEIIVGGSVRGSSTVFPLFRLKTKDDGELIIPSSLVNTIPEQYDKIVFSLQRKIETLRESNNNELYVLSQSIHSLVINIP